MFARIDDARQATVRSGFRLLNRVALPPVKAGFASPPHVGQGVVVLETTGRVTGTRREVPLAAVRIGERIVVSTVRADSHWLRNLEANPAARVWTCGQPQAVTAEVRRGAVNLVVLTPARAVPAASAA